MNSLLLVVLVSCSPVADYPDADPAYGGSSSHHDRHRLFGWLRRHHHDNKSPGAGNGHAVGSWSPAAGAPAMSVEAGTVEAVTLEPAPTVVSSPRCPCAGNGQARGNWVPVAAAPAPTVASPPATAWPAPRLVARPLSETTSAEPPLAISPDAVPRQMPQSPMATTGAEPPRN